MISSRNDDWQDLLAATLVTVAVAVPVLLASAALEVWVTPHLLGAIAALGFRAHIERRAGVPLCEAGIGGP